MWGKGPFVRDESRRSPAGCCVAAEVMRSGKGKKGRVGGNGDNCLVQAEMKGSGPHGEVTLELCV